MVFRHLLQVVGLNWKVYKRGEGRGGHGHLRSPALLPPPCSALAHRLTRNITFDLEPLEREREREREREIPQIKMQSKSQFKLHVQYTHFLDDYQEMVVAVVVVDSSYTRLHKRNHHLVYAFSRSLCWLRHIENAALFLRLGLPSTLIRHANGAFRKRSLNRRNLKALALRFSVDIKHFENEAFQKRWRHDIHVISLTQFSSNTNPKWPVNDVSSNFSSEAWTENNLWEYSIRYVDRDVLS